MSLLLDARRGSRRPRVCKYPRGISSAGQEAVELAASAGLFLDPWQVDVLDAALQERADGKWASFEVGLIVPRQNGKGAILEARELAGLFLFGERMIVHSAHEFKTSIEAFRRIRTLIESTPDLDRKVNNYWMTTGREGIELKNGARLRFVARSKGSGRGFSGDLVVMDEAFALTHEHVEALLPTLSARPNPQVWYTSSPPLDGFSGEPLFALRRRGESPDAPDGLCWMDWGAELDVDPDDRDVWAATNPALGYRITEEFIARERAAMSEEGFKRERLGVWPRSADAGWLVIPRGLWLDAEWREMPSPERFALAVSVEPDLSRAYIGKVGPVGVDASGRTLFGAAVVDCRPGVSWVVDRLYERCAAQMPVAVVMDRNSAAEQVWLECEARDANSSWDELKVADVMVSITPRDECAAANLFFNGVAGVPSPDPDDPEVPPLDPRTVRHLGQPELTAAVASAVKKPSGNTWRWDESVPGTGALKGVSEALFGYLKRVPPMETPWVWDGTL